MLLQKNIKFLDGIRLAVSPYKLDTLIKIINPLVKKYKKISFNVNLMYLSKWKDDEILLKKQFQNYPTKLTLFHLLIVMERFSSEETLFKKLKNFTTNFKIGCHFHNNCGLALLIHCKHKSRM